MLQNIHKHLRFIKPLQMQCCAKLLSQHFFISSLKKHQSPNQKFGELLLYHFIIKNEWQLECAQRCCLSHFRCLALLPLVLNVLPHWSTVRAARRYRDPSAVVCCSSDCRNADDISLVTLCTDGRGHQWGRAFTTLCAREVWGLSGQKDDVSRCISPTLGELLDNVWKG